MHLGAHARTRRHARTPLHTYKARAIMAAYRREVQYRGCFTAVTIVPALLVPQNARGYCLDFFRGAPAMDRAMRDLLRRAAADARRIKSEDSFPRVSPVGRRSRKALSHGVFFSGDGQMPTRAEMRNLAC